jgi:Predicted membrane protein (DUF2306)
MQSITTESRVNSRVDTRTRWKKYTLWIVMASAILSVIFYSEIPLLHQARERAHLHDLRWILIPHAVAGCLALLSGPIQFSNRLRRRHLRFHRIVGRLYVGSVFIAAPLAILSTIYNHDYPESIYFMVAIAVQGGAWAITTGVALIAALGRRIAQHREWMIRSYAVTFTFVGTRVLQPIPAWNHLGRFGFAAAIVCVTLVAVLVPQIASFMGGFTARDAVRMHSPT